VVATRAKDPAEGTNPKTPKARQDGTEGVPNFKLRKLGEGATSALRDIGEASFGPVISIATVHGVEDRVQITNTSVYPWRVHASLLITAADNSMWIGTGWFIGPHTLMTAGHVVYIKNSGVPGRDGWVKSIKVMPGRNGSSMPYGSVTSTSFRSVAGWMNSGDQNYDYGAIIIPTQLGNTTGWLGFGVYSDATLLASVGNISGYPGDKPSGTQWYDARQIASVNSRKVYYDIDTAGGQSGSAVYRIVSGARYAFGIHAYGGATTNSGTRIVQPVYDNMVTWRA
jgi:V8-like Glu-specific endopeptidase